MSRSDPATTSSIRPDKAAAWEQIEALRARLNVLRPEDNILMRLYLDNGYSFVQIARLMGVSKESVARRIRRIARRLAAEPYLRSLTRLVEFTSMEMTILEDYFLRGLSLKLIARRRRCSYYRARKTVRRFKALADLLDRRGWTVQSRKPAEA